MSFWSRIVNMTRGDRLNREIEEELQSHVEEAMEQGRDPVEVRQAFGSRLNHREQSRDIRIVPWLDSLRADSVYGWRQLWKRKVTSAAAILSLALAIGACTSAFRVIDALLLRPLPVAEPQRLYAATHHAIGPDGQPGSYGEWAYPAFQLMRAAVKDQAELLAVSSVDRIDVTYQTDREPEKAFLQFVSGRMFEAFELRPALGRLLTPNDDVKPGGHPYAVLSYDYWKRRFGLDPSVVGRTVRMNERIYEIVGIGPERFTGTETGTVTDIFVPTMMHPGAVKDDWTWHRTLVRLNRGVPVEPVRAKMHATSRAFDENRAKGFHGMTKESIDRFLDQTVVLEPAAAGASDLQSDYRRALGALAVLVTLVLLIACANVANLMTAQAAARAREMALRVSIGAGRMRLVQLVLVESAWLALLAAVLGGVFAWWSAPFVVSRINPSDNPARLFLPTDWRVMGFGLALTFVVTLLFGLAPALRASAVRPASALKGGTSPHSRRRLMNALIAAQVAFCFLVIFVAGLFATTFQRLSHRPLGFSTERILTLDTVTSSPQSPQYWDQVAQHLREVPGVESVAIAGWHLPGGGGWNGFISVNGAPPGPVLAFFLSVSPGWLDAMRVRLIDGRDLNLNDTAPGSALINETFAREYFNGQNPLGRSFEKETGFGFKVVGVVADAPYRNIREPIIPVAFVPFHGLDKKGELRPVRNSTFIVRTASANPLALAATLRREVSRARAEFRVSTVRTEQQLVQAQTVRERLLAMLGMFFATVALVLAGVGLYGVLDYSVLQRRREIGIRMAIGARAGTITKLVTAEVFVMVVAGALAGLGLGMASARSIQSLLYGVRVTDLQMLAWPAITILTAAMLAALPPVIRAVRIDPVAMLRSE